MSSLCRCCVWALSVGLVACTTPDEDRPLSGEDSAEPAEDSSTVDDTAPEDPWGDLQAAIDASALEDVTVLIGTAEGTQWSYSKGDSTPETVYLLASASKWLSAITILGLVEDGVLSLDDSFQAALPWWATEPDDERSDITLEQLLSFTSGFSGDINDIPCVEDAEMTLDECAQEIHDGYFSFTPGTTFAYGPPHLQVAGAAAVAVTGERFNRLWRDQVADPLGLPVTAGYALPSLDNPRVAGGATGSAADYAAVLTALSAGALLSPDSLERMAMDHTPGATLLIDSMPAGQSWHYALGCWRECDEDPYTSDCDLPGVLSSPGAFGFYPWWDQARGFWGVVAFQDLSGAADVAILLGQEWADLAAVALAE